MKRITVVHVSLVLCFFIATAVCSSKLAHADLPEAQIRLVFAEYKSALLSQDGAQAWEAVDNATRRYYDKAVEDALTATRAQLDAKDLATKFLIVRSRAEFPLNELKTMNGKSLFEAGVKRGFVSRTGTAQAEIQSLKVTGAKAEGFAPQAPSVPIFNFTKEEAGWKLNLITATQMGSQMLQEMIVSRKLSVDDGITSFIENLSQKKLDRRAFEGPLS